MFSFSERRRESLKERAALISHGSPGWPCVIKMDGPPVANTHTHTHRHTHPDFSTHLLLLHCLSDTHTNTHTVVRKHLVLWEKVEAGCVDDGGNVHFITKTGVNSVTTVCIVVAHVVCVTVVKSRLPNSQQGHRKCVSEMLMICQKK